MEVIGLFQLENLIVARYPFTFFDLREAEGTPPPEPIAGYLKTAVRLQPEGVREALKGADKERPVVLISENERRARDLGRDLEGAGFSNIYIVAGGVAGLISEL